MAEASTTERMPWRASSVMEEKLRFIFEHQQAERSMKELCERYGIARETGYVWLRRYGELGIAGLMERKRSALRHPNQTPAAMERMVVELRQAHMRWGPKKLKQNLKRMKPGRGGLLL